MDLVLFVNCLLNGFPIGFAVAVFVFKVIVLLFVMFFVLLETPCIVFQSVFYLFSQCEFMCSILICCLCVYTSEVISAFSAVSEGHNCLLF